MKAALVGFFSGLDRALARLNCGLLRSAWGMDIGSGCRISLTATLDKTNPRGVHIGAETDISSRVDIMAHDSVHIQHVDTRIGERCHIGVGAVIYPGVKVGDGCIVAPGAVVTRDVAAGCVVVGNPARVVEKDIRTGKYGLRLDAAGPEGPDRQPTAPNKRDDEARIGALS
jgi:acetyltransferase-like isoleucine patch superfamily enzyme